MSLNNLYLNVLFGIEIIHANRFDYSHGDPDCELPIFKIMDRNLNFTYSADKRREFKVYCPHCDSYFITSIFKHLIIGQGCPTCPSMYQDGRGWELGSVARAAMTVKFRKQASEIHRDAYDYTWAYVIKDNAKVLITCRTHGQFWQLAYAHARGRGCPECGAVSSANKKRGNVECFIKKAREVHGDRYDYSKVNYVNSNVKVIVGCTTHGTFQITPSNHLANHGCSKCFGNSNLSTSEFVDKAREVHGDKYNYDKVDYTNAKSKVVISCPIHGLFEQEAYSHISGKGCNMCGYVTGSEAQRTTLYDFIERAKIIHGDRYDYSQSSYKTANEQITIICPIHGEFRQTPGSHLAGSGCGWCAGNVRSSTCDFIKKARAVHGDRYDYSKVNYVGAKYKVAIICRTHGLFEQEAGSHTTGCGCPACGTYGFNQTIPGIFYNLKPRSDSDAYKIGITNRTVKLRYRSEVVMYDVLDEIHFECGADALELETYLKRKYKQYLYVGSKIFNNTGMSELFSCDILQMERDDPQSPYASILTSAQRT